MPNAADLAAVRERVQRVFRYLQALHEHRNPVPLQVDRYPFVQWFHRLPDHPTVSVAEPRPETEAPEIGDSEAAPPPFVLRVGRPELRQPPPLPPALREWITRWEDPEVDPTVRSTIERRLANDERQQVQFRDDPARVAALNGYLAGWQRWAEPERPARRATRLFEKLFALHTTLQREGEHLELVLGDGVLAWQRSPEPLHHPLLLQPLQLEFDPGIPEFTLVETDRPVEFYSSIFRSIPEADPTWLSEVRTEVENGGFHPLGGASTTRFLQSIPGRLSADGRFEPDGRELRPRPQPTIGRAPVIFVRFRAQGFAAFFEGVLEHLDEGGDLPPIFGNVVGIPLDDSGEGVDVAFTQPGDEPDSILLSKLANPEQIRAAEYLDHSRGVLVQGPPGTGKTHTIANLLGHLLANGKSVLVTSHATKALRVLREQVVESLRPLCVSVLDSASRSQTELQHAVQTIVSRLGAGDSARLKSEAQRCAQRRSDLLTQIRAVRVELLRARAAEYEDVVLNGESLSPSEAARVVARGAGLAEWIPSPVQAAAPLPLSAEEVAELYRTNQQLSAADEPEVEGSLPELAPLPAPADFRALVEARSAAEEHARSDLPKMWCAAPTAGDEARLLAVTVAAEKAIEPLTIDADWPFAAIAAGMRGKEDERPWRDLLQRISDVAKCATAVQPDLLEYGPELASGVAPAEQVRTLEEISAYLGAGRSLGTFTLLFHPRWKALLKSCCVDGRPPSESEHVRALLGLARLQDGREGLCRRWDRQIVPLGGAPAESLGPQPERSAAQYAQQIEHLLAWSSALWQPVAQELQALGFRWEDLLREQPPRTEMYGDLLRLRDAVQHGLLPALRARTAAARLLSIDEKLRRVDNALAPFGQVAIADRLRQALRRGDVGSWETAYRRLADLWRLKLVLRRRAELLERLAAAAPGWARCIGERRPGHDGDEVPGDVSAAWRWRQLHDELRRRNRTDPEQLQLRLETLRQQLRETTAELIEHRTWEQQHQRTGHAERQALMGYSDAVKRIGRGTGKRAPIFRALAQKMMSQCRTAVPVWIMPLSRVAETFDPRHTVFDVVIIDEASQCDVMGLLAFYLGKKVLVVGDDEQVSPSAVGQNVTVVHRLIEEHLAGIPNAPLYDGQMSVYELAQQSFQRSLRLVEHFRCVPDIIEFSNHLSYQGEITPLRDASEVQLRPFVVEHRVAYGHEEGKINNLEAAEVASLLAACLEQPEYRGKTFGVISLVGTEQAFVIEKILQSHLPPQQIEERQILAGNAAQFQGDERDVMFLSVVKSGRDSGGPLPMMSEGYLNMNKKRLNVAASRARDQMWVVHSLNPATDLKAGDLRLQLIDHARDPNAVTELIRRGQSRAESEFEKRVIEHLVRQGYQVFPQYWVGYYRIDIVVEDASGAKVAVECDGDRFHPQEKLSEDLARQAVLERLGWRFIRIRGSEFFREPTTTMARVTSRLREMGIEPGRREQESPPQQSGLVDRVRRRAAELRREWGVAEDATVLEPEMAEAVDDLLAFRSVATTPEEPPPLQRSLVFGRATEANAEEDRASYRTAGCPICETEDRKLVLYRGKQICGECVGLLEREMTTVPAPTRILQDGR